MSSRRRGSDGLARGRRERREGRLAQRADERADAEPADPHDGDEDEREQAGEREIEAADEARVLAEEEEHRGPAAEIAARVAGGHVAHVVRHRAEHAERRQAHDHVRVLEHDLGHALEEAEHRLACVADARERDAEEGREHNDGQDVALRGVLDQVRREQVQGDLPAVFRRRGLHGSLHAEVEWQRVAGADHVRDDEPDAEGEGRDDLEVEERLRPHATDRLEVARLRDADDDRRDEEGDDEALDELDEGLREEAEEVVRVGVSILREEAPEHHAEREADEDPEGARSVPSLRLCHRADEDSPGTAGVTTRRVTRGRASRYDTGNRWRARDRARRTSPPPR
jgi:hypothetical protein